jgi:Putative zinc-binding metallo-peptidase
MRTLVSRIVFHMKGGQTRLDLLVDVGRYRRRSRRSGPPWARTGIGDGRRDVRWTLGPTHFVALPGYTAAAFGFAASGATFERRGLGPSGFDTIIERWLPLAWALNMVHRSMGRDDLYPFVLPTVVLEKIRFIRTVIDEMACDPAKLASTGSRG